MIEALAIQPSKHSKRPARTKVSAEFELRCWVENFLNKEWFRKRAMHKMMLPMYIIKVLQKEGVLPERFKHTTRFDVESTGKITLASDSALQQTTLLILSPMED